MKIRTDFVTNFLQRFIKQTRKRSRIWNTGSEDLISAYSEYSMRDDESIYSFIYGDKNKNEEKKWNIENREYPVTVYASVTDVDNATSVESIEKVKYGSAQDHALLYYCGVCISANG